MARGEAHDDFVRLRYREPPFPPWDPPEPLEPGDEP